MQSDSAATLAFNPTSGGSGGALDRDRFPRVASYLGRLPAGLDSYPVCRICTRYVREYLRAREVRRPPAGLPWTLARLFDPREQLGAWVPEVQAQAAFLAAFEASGLSDAQYTDDARAATVAVLSSTYYRGFMVLDSPWLLVAGAPLRWAAIHQGTELRCHRDEIKGGSFTLLYPDRLFDELSLRAVGAAATAMLELSKAVEASVRLEEYDSRSAQFRVRWR